MAKERLAHIPSGHDGNGFISIDGKVIPAFKIAKVTAKLEAVKDSKRFLGDVMTQNVVRGLNGSGDISYYHKTAALIDAMKQYKETGVYPEITLQYYSESPSEGRCEVILTGVVLDSTPFGALDDGSDTGQVSECPFPFADVVVITRFKG